MSSSATPLPPQSAPSTALVLIPSTTPSSPAPNTTNNALLAGPQPPTFPPPSTFDFLPQTHDLLSRVLPPPVQGTPTNLPAIPPLELKEVDAEASRIRIKISKARTLISELPDINRSIDDQAVEIEELEAKIQKQKDILGRIRELKPVRDAAAVVAGSARETAIVNITGEGMDVGA